MHQVWDWPLSPPYICQPKHTVSVRAAEAEGQGRREEVNVLKGVMSSFLWLKHLDQEVLSHRHLLMRTGKLKFDYIPGCENINSSQ